jgi:hypothetical protein
VYSTGVAKDQTDSAAIRLREYMMTTELPRHVLGKQEVYLRCCTAITAFLEYRGLTKLYCRTDVAFPLPEVEGL